MRIRKIKAIAAMCVLLSAPAGAAGDGKFIIQSHRGAGELSTDNTMEAFELGWEMGTYPEADVRETKDGVLVAFHDKDFKRVVKDAGPELEGKGVKDLTYEELSRLDVGSWKGKEHEGQRVPKLKDVFARMQGNPERHLYLDIKEVDLAKLAAEVTGMGIGGQVVLASTRYQIIRDWKKLVPDSDTLVWIGGTEEAQKKRIGELRDAGFEGVTQIQLHVRLPGDAKDLKDGEPFSPSRAFLKAAGEEFAGRGIVFQSLPWKANTPEIYHQLMDLGVVSFASDHPDVTLKAVRNHVPKAAATPN
ncbi:MAG: hypothetical protein KF712_10725 [Akkermansiaceae bacterium]|nr:hypothetical protein [Akkermansiaceae bacterium]